MTSLAAVLKKTRRNIFVHGNNWRTLIIAPTTPLLVSAFKEAENLMDAGSLAVEEVNHAELTIRTEKGGFIRFVLVQDGLDMYKVAGGQWPEIVWMYGEYPPPAKEYIGSVWRSPFIEPDLMLWYENVHI